MIPEIIKQWEENKDKLREYFKITPQEEYCNSYKDILIKVLELCIPKSDEYSGWGLSNITVVDNGDYQGTQIFIIPKDTYQPDIEDYITTNTYYGSCSGCDTLLSISSFNEEKLPDESQVEQYMTLALHLVQRMKRLT